MSKSSNKILRKGYPLGIITDGDEYDRPAGSLSILKNMDYDVETGEINIRNSTKNSLLLTGLDIPAGYEIMPNGIKLFSFNEPADTEFCLAALKHNTTGDVKIFVNKWYNPPAASSPINYENHISSVPIGWQSEWIELTFRLAVTGFVKVSNTSFRFNWDNSLNDSTNYYRGWFIYNASSNSYGSVEYDRFACLETSLKNYDPPDYILEGTIQTRQAWGTTQYFDLRNWNDNDNVYLCHYPVAMHKQNDWDDIEDIQLIKTPQAIKLLIGQEGNLWFGFVNKDIKKVTDTSRQNKNKFFGVWFDYDAPPVICSTDYLLITDFKIGVAFKSSDNGGGTTFNVLAFVAVFDGYQPIVINKSILPAGSYNLPSLTLYMSHHYSRRITGIEVFRGDGDNIDIVDTTNSIWDWNIQYTGNNTYRPCYDRDVTAVRADKTEFEGGSSLLNYLQYLFREKFWTKAKFGVYTQGRTFAGGDDETPDGVRYSLFKRDSIYALQNTQDIESGDNDKITAIGLLGIDPIIFKNNSHHAINIEGQVELNWRAINSRSKIGVNYPRNIIRTPYGLIFANNEGIWLISSINADPINLVRKRRLIEYRLIANKGNINGEWYSRHNTLWLQITPNDFWVCKLSQEEQQIGWKNYSFHFEPSGVLVDTEGSLHLYGTDFIYKLRNDDELINAIDADSNGIDYEFEENYSAVDIKSPFHHIESAIGITEVVRDDLVENGNEDPITIKIYGEHDELLFTKVVKWNVVNETKRTIVFGNPNSDRQTAIKVNISGTMNYRKSLKIREIISLVKPVPSMWKEGYSKIAG